MYSKRAVDQFAYLVCRKFMQAENTDLLGKVLETNVQ